MEILEGVAGRMARHVLLHLAPRRPAARADQAGGIGAGRVDDMAPVVDEVSDRFTGVVAEVANHVLERLARDRVFPWHEGEALALERSDDEANRLRQFFWTLPYP